MSHNIEKTVNTRTTDSQKSSDLPKTIPHAEHTFQIRTPIFSLHSGDVANFSGGISWIDQVSNSPCFRFNFKTSQSEKIFEPMLDFERSLFKCTNYGFGVLEHKFS